MIKIKHFLDGLDVNDGVRVWIEPIGVTRDLRQWCSIDHLLTAVAPPVQLWRWFAEHPDGYDYFRGRYHECLSRSPHRHVLQQLVWAAAEEDFTLLHQGDDPTHNTATALYEFLAELAAYLPE
jgi:uncharacterized protein YeaO (DUF488 family)